MTLIVCSHLVTTGHLGYIITGCFLKHQSRRYIPGLLHRHLHINMEVSSLHLMFISSLLLIAFIDTHARRHLHKGQQFYYDFKFNLAVKIDIVEVLFETISNRYIISYLSYMTKVLHRQCHYFTL